MKIISEEIYIFFYVVCEKFIYIYIRKFIYFEKFNLKKIFVYNVIICEINHHLFIIFIFCIQFELEIFFITV